MKKKKNERIDALHHQNCRSASHFHFRLMSFDIHFALFSLVDSRLFCSHGQCCCLVCHFALKPIHIYLSVRFSLELVFFSSRKLVTIELYPKIQPHKFQNYRRSEEKKRRSKRKNRKSERRQTPTTTYSTDNK